MIHVIAIGVTDDNERFNCENRKDDIPRANGGALREDVRERECEVAKESKIGMIAFEASRSSAFEERSHGEKCRVSCEMVA